MQTDPNMQKPTGTSGLQGPPQGSRPEASGADFRPMQQMTADKQWLPYVYFGGIGVAILCAAVFAVYALFFYKPTIPVEADAGATAPQLETVEFKTEEEADTALPAQPASVQTEEQEPAEQQPVVEEVAEDTSQPADEPADNAQPVDEPADDPQPVVVTEPETQPASSGPLMASPDYGIHAFLFWRPEVADRDLNLIKDAGFTWVKQEFAWREIEGAEKGAFNWENSDRMMEQIGSHNLKVLARVGVQPAWAGGGYPEIGPPTNYQDYGDFLFDLASRYKGRIHAYQIWNEPNLSREWGERPPSPAEYTELLKIAHESIKRADPDALVITAGLAPTTRNDNVAMPDMFFVQGLYDAGAKPYFDLLGVHGAGYKAPPEMDPGEIARDLNFSNPGDHEAGVPEELRRIYGFRHVEDIRDIMVRNGDAEKRVAVLEFGWTTDSRQNSPYRWHHVSEELQGEYIVRAYQYAKANWQPWIGVMSVIYMPDAEWTNEDEQFYWSIIVPRWPDAWPRPAYWMIKDMPK